MQKRLFGSGVRLAPASTVGGSVHPGFMHICIYACMREMHRSPHMHTGPSSMQAIRGALSYGLRAERSPPQSRNAFRGSGEIT